MAFKPQYCTNPDCLRYSQPGGHFVKKGHYKIKRLNQLIRRFQCLACKKTLSSRSFKADYYHKKMDLNKSLQKLLTEGNSIRGCGRILGLTYKNTYNKFLWLIRQAQQKKSVLRPEAKVLFFDEMETIHHTKCKPLSIAIMVNENYEILDLQVAEMPAKGRLSRFSVKKYGLRQDQREQVMEKMFERLRKNLRLAPMMILSDAKPSYRKFVEKYFPEAQYEVHSRLAKERLRDRLHEKLHKKRFDPMFALNQRCAKLRSDIRRLTRRSWCTTKSPVNLQGHLDLYIVSQSC